MASSAPVEETKQEEVKEEKKEESEEESDEDMGFGKSITVHISEII